MDHDEWGCETLKVTVQCYNRKLKIESDKVQSVMPTEYWSIHHIRAQYSVLLEVTSHKKLIRYPSLNSTETSAKPNTEKYEIEAINKNTTTN